MFGSVARGYATPRSDLDLLIVIGGPTTPWFPGGLVVELEELLGCRVEVVEAEALREEMRERITKEAVSL